MTQLKSGNTAPSFSLADTDGRRVGFDAASGGRKALVFYKVTCPTCQFGMPFYDRLYQAFADSGIPIFAVVQDNAQDAREFADTYGVTMPQLIDQEPYDVSNAYKIEHVPTLFIVGDGGEVELASASFSKVDIERAAGLLAGSDAGEVPEIFGSADAVPEFRPG